MSKARALSTDEIRGLREELSGGGTPTVWFTASAVGVPEGRSGKVIALDEPAEGDFIQVRPAGSKDVLSFSAAEVTLVKPPRKRKEPEQAGAKATSPASTGSAGVAAASGGGPASGGGAAGSGKAGESATGAGSKPTAQRDGSAKAGNAPKTAAKAPASANSQAADQKAAGSAARRKPKSPAGATVVLTADEAGQWNVEVSTGKKRVLRPTPVTASAVAQAAKSLHSDVAAAVEPLLEAARDQQRDRVEQLQRELAEAQRKLDELAD